MQKRYILSGTPGAGKTTVLRALARRGLSVVEEAATDVIALEQSRDVDEPWTGAAFVEAIVTLQQQRQVQGEREAVGVQMYDRSPICTYALCVYLGIPVPRALSAELDRIKRDAIYERQVFFMRNLGFCEPTAARRITFEDSLCFERIHEDTYHGFGYQLVDIPAGALEYRAAAICAVVRRPSGWYEPRRGRPGA